MKPSSETRSGAVAPPEARLLRRGEAAEYLSTKWGIPRTPRTLAKEASLGTGPAYRKAGRVPLFEQADLDSWAQATLGPKACKAHDLKARPQAEARP